MEIDLSETFSSPSSDITIDDTSYQKFTACHKL